MSRIEDGGAVEAGLVERLSNSLPDEYASLHDDNRSWSGSAFVAGEMVDDEQLTKAGLYSHLCLVSSYLVAAEELANDAIAAAAEITRLRAENAGMREALGAMIDGDVAYAGAHILIPAQSHSEAISIVRRARAALSKASQAEGQTR